jgi:hypothetical protein
MRPRRLSFELPGQVRANHRVANEPHLTDRIRQHSYPSVHIPHDSPNNDRHGDQRRSSGSLFLQDNQYCHSRCSLLLGLYKPDFFVGRSHVQVCQAPLLPFPGEASTAALGRSETSLKASDLISGSEAESTILTLAQELEMVELLFVWL